MRVQEALVDPRVVIGGLIRNQGMGLVELAGSDATDEMLAAFAAMDEQGGDLGALTDEQVAFLLKLPAPLSGTESHCSLEFMYEDLIKPLLPTGYWVECTVAPDFDHLSIVVKTYLLAGRKRYAVEISRTSIKIRWEITCGDVYKTVSAELPQILNSITEWEREAKKKPGVRIASAS